MEKSQTRVSRMSDAPRNDVVPGTPAYRIGLVWPLTLEATSLSKSHDAERRLQRTVTRLIRNKRSSGRTKDLADAEALEELGGSDAVP
jgi:hypothetical protein